MLLLFCCVFPPYNPTSPVGWRVNLNEKPLGGRAALTGRNRCSVVVVSSARGCFFFLRSLFTTTKMRCNTSKISVSFTFQAHRKKNLQSKPDTLNGSTSNKKNNRNHPYKILLTVHFFLFFACDMRFEFIRIKKKSCLLSSPPSTKYKRHFLALVKTHKLPKTTTSVKRFVSLGEMVSGRKQKKNILLCENG